jgi:hypothetical protein
MTHERNSPNPGAPRPEPAGPSPRPLPGGPWPDFGDASARRGRQSVTLAFANPFISP